MTSAESIFANQSYGDLYIDDAYNQFSYVIAKSINAYADQTGAKDLMLGASSNVHIEAIDSISTYVKDTGAVTFYSTTVSNNVRTDREILSIKNLSGVTSVTAGDSSNSIIVESTDASKTLGVSTTTAAWSNDFQAFKTTQTKGFYFDNVVSTDLFKSRDIVSPGHVFGQDMGLYYFNSNAVNPGDLSEAGYSFRINTSLQLELVKYGKFIVDGGSTKAIYRRVGIFGANGINSNMSSDVADFAAFASLSNLFYGGGGVAASNQPPAPPPVTTFPPAAMTGDTTVINGATYVASASSASRSVFNAFNKTVGTTSADLNNTAWTSGTGMNYDTSGVFTGSIGSVTVGNLSINGEWIQLQLPSAVTLTSYAIHPTIGFDPQRNPSDFTLLGSMTGTYGSWEVVSVNSNQTWDTTGSGTPKTFTNVNGGSYSYYRLVITAIQAGYPWGYTELQELTFYT